MPKRVFIIAGEASGDVYGAQLIRSLRNIDPGIEVAGLGGDLMAATGITFLYNLVREFAVMGLLPVILGIPKVMRFLEICVDYIDAHRPDVVVLIDYPGFNLYFATYTKKRNIPTVYYVTPQIWAWAPWRIKKIKRLMSKMLVIFPFEVPFYEKAGIPVAYVGHPLLDHMSLFQPDASFAKRQNLNGRMLTLLPGSRRAIIRGNLPVMLWLTQELCQQESVPAVCLALGSDKYLSLVEEIVEQGRRCWQLPEIRVVVQDTYNAIHHAHLAIVTSGTSTLETAILGRPMVIIYRIKGYHKFLVELTSFLKCQFFGLPNIVSGRQVVPEHLAVRPQAAHIMPDLLSLWRDTPARRTCLQDIAGIREALQQPGASDKAAMAIWQLITASPKT